MTLISLNERYSLNDAKGAAGAGENGWQDFLDNLTDYPEDSTGLRISEKYPYAISHRHYSHLLMIEPLHILNWDMTGDEHPGTPTDARTLIRKSVDHWQSITGALLGYSYTGSAAMYAQMGDGQTALAKLNGLFSAGYIKKNTLYAESGPVIETPFAGVQSLNELYLQSWGNKIRVFPAVPSVWTTGKFIDMRASGAFLVSAERQGGKTISITVKSEKGNKCRIQTGMTNPVVTGAAATVLDAAAGLIEFDTAVNGTYVISGS
jgi:hypothetical protein